LSEVYPLAGLIISVLAMPFRMKSNSKLSQAIWKMLNLPQRMTSSFILRRLG